MLRSFALKTLTVIAVTTAPLVVSAQARPAEPVSPAAGEQKSLRLPQALTLALESSPELAPFPFEIRAAEARRLEASLLPNPKADLQVEDVLGSGDFGGGRRAQTTIQLSQLVELGGKRAARVAAAKRSHDLARAGYEEKRVDVLADVTSRFVDVLERQHILDLASEAVRLDRRTVRTLRRQIEGGAGSLLEEKRAEVSLARSRLEEEDIRHELAVARTSLAAAWGAPLPTFDRVEGELFPRAPVPAWEELRKRLEHSPELLRRATEKRLRTAELRLARARRFPDLALSAGPRRFEESDEHALVFGFSVPLPVFDRNQGEIAESTALARKSGAEQAAAEVRLRALLYRLWQEMSHARHVLDVLESDILPATEEALRISRRGFDRGRFSHLELLDVRRAFLEARRRRVDAAASFHRSVLEIERVTGAPIDLANALANPGGVR